MVVCKYWQQGHCRFGERCRFEHPSKNLNTQNRFGVFQSPENDRTSRPANGPFAGPSPSRTLPFNLNKDVIINDLSKERPQWILSAYGPGRDAPTQLFGGLPREQSFEEMRLHHYLAAASGNQTQAILEAQGLVNNAEQQMQTILGDVDGAITYVIEGAKTHPNRIEVCKGLAGSGPGQAAQFGTSRLGGPVVVQSSAFGSPSPLPGVQSASPSSFGQPSTFGQPSSTFGQPSAFGRPPSTTFSQPTITPNQPSSTFGQPSSSFGRPTTSFGQPSSTFGQPSLGNATPASAYAQPSAFGSTKPAPSTFGQPTGFGSTQQSLSSFGQPSRAFSQAPAAVPPQSTFFGQPSQSTQTSGFGQPARVGSANNFGQPTNSAPLKPFSKPAPSATNGTFGQVPPATSDGTLKQRDSQNKLTLWHSKVVSYINGEPFYTRDDGILEKIWFPDGPPSNNKDTQLPDEAYDGMTVEAYMYMREHKAFKDGIMPDKPPKREWCSWDF